ncbi:RNA polymerase sigma factor [Sphingomonas swuensis]|uniref:RNA polymerase sigma factor n=1 Tax=Sphingomonas swuensis TaxID=977800 RepID=A0ABP7SM15_9SPHN
MKAKGEDRCSSEQSTSLAFDKALEGELPSLRRRLNAYAFRLCRDADEAEDLVQEAYARAIRFRDTFEPGTNLTAWMMVILRNVFLSQYRQRRSRPYVPIDEETVHGMPAELPSQQAALNVRDVIAQLERLPPKLRNALVSVAIDGVAYSELAEQTGEPIGTIKARVFRARVMLGELVNGARGSI